jgi:4-amino-4-deoxy-L-arabinose transferase-like glycosyltransferase
MNTLAGVRDLQGNQRMNGYFVLAGIAILYLSLLSAVGIFDPEEGRHVSIATAMLRTGDLVVPQLQGFPYLEKPPLAYWLIAASFRAFGRGEFAARLPVAILGLAGIGAVLALGRAVLGATAGWLSAGVLALTIQWFVQARYMTTDMVLSAWITMALAAFYFAFHAKRRGAYLVFFLAMAMATLAKGIIGVVLPCGVVAIFVAWTRQWRVLREMRPVLGALLFLAIVVPWFVLVERRIPEFLHYFVVDQHIARFLGQAGEHPAPLWFFIPVIAFGFFPWIVHLPAAASSLRARADFSAYLWSWFAVIFLFFSASKEKLMGYVLPAYPALALLVGGYFARLLEPELAVETGRRVCRAALVSGGVLLVLAPISIYGLSRFMRQDGRLSIDELGFWPWGLAGVYAVTGVSQIVFALRRRAGLALAGSALCQLLAFVIFIGGASSADAALGTRPIGSALARLAGPEDPIVLYRMPQPSVEYYVGRPPTLFKWSGEHAWGMKVRPDPSLVIDDSAELTRLLSSPKTVWVVTRAEDRAAAQEFGVPMELILGNRKRTIYRNHPAEAQ